MRIGFFTDSYLPRLDGIAISLEIFRKQLEALGHEVYVFCPHRPGEPQTPNPRIIRFKSHPTFLYEGYRNTFPFARKHFQAIAALQLDVVHLHTPLQLGILGRYVARRHNLPLVFTCHSDPGLFEDYKWGKPLVALALGLGTVRATRSKGTGRLTNPLGFNARLRAYLNQFDLVIAPSQKIYTSLRRLGVHARMETLPTGFDPDSLSADTHRSQLRQRYNIADDQIVFMSTSRLVKEKRIEFLLRAFALVSRSRSNYVFLVASDGPDRDSLVRLAHNLGVGDRVKFLGKLEHTDLVAALSAADILVSASLRETQGLVFNEAAAVGLPIIALENDISPVVRHEESALVPANDLADYARAMLDLATNAATRARLGARAQELAHQYDAAHQARQLERLYRELLTSPRVKS